VKTAEDITAAIPEGEEKKWVEAESRRLLVLRSARGGDMARAIQLALELPSADEKILALVGREYLNLGYDDHSNHFEEGIVAVPLAKGDRSGAKASALKTLSLLPEAVNGRRALAATSVVRAFCILDDLPSARKALALIPPKPDDVAKFKAPGLEHWWDLKAKAYLASAEVRAGNDKAAAALAEDFSRPREQAHILQYVALAQARAKRIDASKATFARCNELVADKDIHNLVGVQALAGDYDGAAETAKRSKQAGGDWIWECLAGYKAEAGDFKAAWEAAAQLTSSSGTWRLCLTVQRIAELQTRAGKADAAREWAEKESNLLSKAYALFGIAEGLYRGDGRSHPKQ
jgi:hypothetical protein